MASARGGHSSGKGELSAEGEKAWLGCPDVCPPKTACGPGCYKCTCTGADMHACTRTCTRTRACTHKHHVCGCMYTHAHVCTCSCTCVYTCPCNARMQHARTCPRVYTHTRAYRRVCGSRVHLRLLQRSEAFPADDGGRPAVLGLPRGGHPGLQALGWGLLDLLQPGLDGQPPAGEEAVRAEVQRERLRWGVGATPQTHLGVRPTGTTRRPGNAGTGRARGAGAVSSSKDESKASRGSFHAASLA